MKRREFLAGATATATSLAFQPHAAIAEPARRPNVIVIVADQLRYQSCGYAGDEYARTPNIDRLAAEGCNFHQTVSSTPVCSAFRASLLTGKYSHGTGMVINELRMSPAHECFGHVLTRSGYRTGFIGKWHMWANQLGHHNVVKNGFVPPGAYRLGFDGLWAGYNFNHNYKRSPYFLDDATPHFRADYEPNEQTNQAIHFLRESAHQPDPFALFLCWGPPHAPWTWDNVDEQHADLYRDKKLPLAPNYSTQQDDYCDAWQKLPPNFDRRVQNWMRIYYAMSANIDWNLGRLMKALEESGQAENTIVVFTSDHGEMFGAHGRQAKLTFHEEAARIPMLVRWPTHIPAKSVSDVTMGTPDVMPTILGLMGLKSPASVQGTDLSANALGRSSSAPDAAYLQGMGATASWEEGVEWRAVRDQEFTYAIYHRDGREKLFHNRIDPWQMNDLAQERAFSATLGHYRQMSLTWRKQYNDVFESAGWYRDHWTVDRNITMTADGVSHDLKALAALEQRWFAGGVGERAIAMEEMEH